jgi:hypothetical protein
MAQETSFEVELRKLLNAKSRENESNTPDFILANYLLGCYDTFVLATRMRDNWWWGSLDDDTPVDLWEFKRALERRGVDLAGAKADANEVSAKGS